MTNKITRLNKSDQFLGAAVALSMAGMVEAGFDPSWPVYSGTAVACFGWGFRHYYKATVR